MTLQKHLEEAAGRLKEASWAIGEARDKPLTLDSLREWLSALTDYSIAATEVQEYSNESIHEKLHEVAGQVGLKKFKTGA